MLTRKRSTALLQLDVSQDAPEKWNMTRTWQRTFYGHCPRIEYYVGNYTRPHCSSPYTYHQTICSWNWPQCLLPYVQKLVLWLIKLSQPIILLHSDRVIPISTPVTFEVGFFQSQKSETYITHILSSQGCCLSKWIYDTSFQDTGLPFLQNCETCS